MYKINVRQGKKINWPRQCDTFETRTRVSEFRQNITLLHHISTHYIKRDTRGGALAKLFMKNISVLQKIFSLISSWIRSARRRLRRGRRRGCCRRSGCGAAARTPSAGWCRPAANHSSVSMWLTNEKPVLPAAWPARGRGTSVQGSAGPGHNNKINEISRNSK